LKHVILPYQHDKVLQCRKTWSTTVRYQYLQVSATATSQPQQQHMYCMDGWFPGQQSTDCCPGNGYGFWVLLQHETRDVTKVTTGTLRAHCQMV